MVRRDGFRDACAEAADNNCEVGVVASNGGGCGIPAGAKGRDHCGQLQAVTEV